MIELEKRMAALEAENATLRKELGYSKEGKAPGFVAPAGKSKKFTIGGFVQANGEIGDAPDARWRGISDRFLLRRARLNATATFAEDFQAKVEFDLGANTLGASSGFRAQLTDGFVEWNKFPEAVVKAGQFKVPFGFEQLASDTKIFTIERALANDRLTVGRQVGAGLSGDLAGKRVSYALGAYNGTGVNSSTNDNDQFLWAGRLAATAYQGEASGQKVRWSVGTNAFTTRDTGAFTGRREGFGLDTQVAWGPAEVWGEWLRNEASPSVGASTTSEGYSLLAAWLFNPQWQGVVRFESYDSNTARGDTTTDLWTFGINHLMKGDDLKLSLNYIFGEAPPPEDDGGRLIARIQVIF